MNGGTYDFPGSNSGADLYSLCGWIPEVVQLTDQLDRDAEWQRLSEVNRLLSPIST